MVFFTKQGPHRFWNAMENENAIFQELNSFGKDRNFRIAKEELWIFVWKNSKNILKLM